jgi:hypothetical protein
MKRTLIAAVSATFLLPAFAAEEPVVVIENSHIAAAEAAREYAESMRHWAEEFSHEMRTSMGAMFGPRLSSSKVVKGAPYSAEMVTETTQSLADGNTISRRKTGHVYRDSEGRTRQETASEGKTRSIFINDPVERKHYVLTPGARRAIATPIAMPSAAPRAMHRDRQVFRVSGTEVRIEDGTVYVDGKVVSPGKVELTSKSGKKVVVDGGRVFIDGKEVAGPGHVVVRKFEGPDGVQREEVRIQVVRADDAIAPLPPVPPVPPTPGVAPVAPVAPVPSGAFAFPAPPATPIPPIPGVHTMRFESTAHLGKGVTTQLGDKHFDGVRAEGKSTVWTIAAGKIGNRNPINITSETWYSPELQVTVHSRYHDPRTGETVYRLANIRRDEPSAELFKVPEDYKVKSRGRG